MESGDRVGRGAVPAKRLARVTATCTFGTCRESKSLMGSTSGIDRGLIAACYTSEGIRFSEGGAVADHPSLRGVTIGCNREEVLARVVGRAIEPVSGTALRWYLVNAARDLTPRERTRLRSDLTTPMSGFRDPQVVETGDKLHLVNEIDLPFSLRHLTTLALAPFCVAVFGCSSIELREAVAGFGDLKKIDPLVVASLVEQQPSCVVGRFSERSPSMHVFQMFGELGRMAAVVSAMEESSLVRLADSRTFDDYLDEKLQGAGLP